MKISVCVTAHFLKYKITNFFLFQHMTAQTRLTSSGSQFFRTKISNTKFNLETIVLQINNRDLTRLRIEYFCRSLPLHANFSRNLGLFSLFFQISTHANRILIYFPNFVFLHVNMNYCEHTLYLEL